MTKEEAIKYFEKRKEKSLMLMRKAKADTPTNNKFREIVAKKIEAFDMAISALFADGEYIKKEEAINGIDSWVKMNKYYHPYAKGTTIPVDEAKDVINTCKTYSFPDREKGEWIPIEKRLPEKSGRVYVTVDYDRTRFVTTAIYDKTIRKFIQGFCDPVEHVTAWREDIEPYKAESEGTE